MAILVSSSLAPASLLRNHTDRFLKHSSSAQIRSNALARVPCWVQRAESPFMAVTDVSAGGHTGKQDAHAGGHRGVGEAGVSAEGRHPTAGSCCQGHAHPSAASGHSAAWQSPREPAQMGNSPVKLVWLRVRVSAVLHSDSARLPAGAHNSCGLRWAPPAEPMHSNLGTGLPPVAFMCCPETPIH